MSLGSTYSINSMSWLHFLSGIPELRENAQKRLRLEAQTISNGIYFLEVAARKTLVYCEPFLSFPESEYNALDNYMFICYLS